MSLLAHLCCTPTAAQTYTDLKAGKLDALPTYSQTCIVESQDNGSDDVPSIIEAFQKCHRDSHIVFLNTTYQINQVLEFDNLENVKIEINGTLQVRVIIFFFFLNAEQEGAYPDRVCSGVTILSIGWTILCLLVLVKIKNRIHQLPIRIKQQLSSLEVAILLLRVTASERLTGMVRPGMIWSGGSPISQVRETQSKLR
jgi:hypothetical protein